MENAGKLIADHLDRVDSIAATIWVRLPKSVDIDDLKQAGAIGLMQAARSFDPARGLRFLTHARHRIRGAMMDYLREVVDCDVPRLVRQRNNAIRKAREAGRDAAAATGLTAGQVAESERVPERVSLEKIVTVNGKAVTLGDQIPATPDPDSRLAIREMTRHLSREDRLMVHLRFEAGLSYKEIASAIGVSESLVWQRMPRVLARLRWKATPA